jgi:uracil-DNA glycosylase
MKSSTSQNNNKSEKLARLAQEVAGLTQSPLYQYRLENNFHPVFGEGSPDAGVLFIGEAPGKQEAQKGRPFVGASGRVLNKLLQSIGLERDDVYITNVVKDRPPDNRDPRQEEINLYAPFLAQQIEIIQPRVIATLGRFAMDFVLARFNLPETGQKISQLHGRPIEAQAQFGPLTILPLYHPAVALYNQDQQKTLEADFRVLQEIL